MFWTVLAIVASILTAFQLIPQTVKTIKTKDFKGVSLMTFSLIMTTATLWLLYGVHLKDSAIIFANSVALVCSSIIVYLKLTTKHEV